MLIKNHRHLILLNSIDMDMNKCTNAIMGISITSPSTVTTILSVFFVSLLSSVVSNSTTAGMHNPGATGFVGFFTFNWKFCNYKDHFFNLLSILAKACWAVNIYNLKSSW